MKIRSGFVSNSSSSSFVVSVPKDFVVTKDMISEQGMVELWENELIDEEDIVSQRALDYLQSQVDILKSGSTLYAGYRGCDAFWAVQNLLEEQDMIVMTLDGPGGDGEDIITPFKDQRKRRR